MKKLFYLVSVLVVLTLICVYIKSRTAPIEIETPAVLSDTVAKDDCDCKTECICPEGENDCDCIQTKSVCTCTQSDGKVVTVESVETNNDEIEEDNPEETSDEDETVVNE